MATSANMNRQPRARGAKRTLPDPKDIPYVENHIQMMASMFAEQPQNKECDLRPMVDVVYNQGSYNSCVVNAICNAMQFACKKYAKDNGAAPAGMASFDPSRMAAYWLERDAESQLYYNCGGGTRESLNGIKEVGLLSEESWPYGDGDAQVRGPKNEFGDDLFDDEDSAVQGPHDYLGAVDARDKLPGSYNIEFANIGACDSDRRDLGSITKLIEQTLSAGQPVILGIQEYKRFRYNTNSGNYEEVPSTMGNGIDADTGVMSKPPEQGPVDDRDDDLKPSEQPEYESYDGGHEMLIVGYSNSQLLVRNSWGADWGSNNDWGHWGDKTWGESNLPLKGHYLMPYEWLEYTKYVDDLWTMKVI